MNPGVTAAELLIDVTESHTHFGEGEDRYWRDQYSSRPYAQSGRSYHDYRPAYQYGHDAALHHQGRRWEDTESELASGWEKARGTSHLAWQDVKDAAATPGTASSGPFPATPTATEKRRRDRVSFLLLSD